MQRGPVTEARRFEMIAEIGVLEEHSILEIGCDHGGFLDWLGREHAGLDYTGICSEPSETESLRRRFPAVRILNEAAGRLLGLDADWVFIRPAALPKATVATPEHLRDLVERWFPSAHFGLSIDLSEALSDPDAFDAGRLASLLRPLASRVTLHHEGDPGAAALFLYR